MSSRCIDVEATLYQLYVPSGLTVWVNKKKLFTLEILQYWNRQAWANSIDPDQMLQNMLSDQGLHCLPLIQQFLDIFTASKLNVQILGQVR